MEASYRHYLERECGGQSLQMPQHLNFNLSNQRPELVRSYSQSQQPALSGYMHRNPVFQTRQNESNILGMDFESGQLNSTSRGFPMLNLETTESPVNYNFFGVQQQMSGQHPGILQPLARQQLPKQMQELHEQQELQRQIQEPREHSSVNQVNGKHSTALINGVPVHGTLSYARQSETMTANGKWMQQGLPPDMHGSPVGHMISPRLSQEQYFKSVGHKQVNQSLYGAPVASSQCHASEYSQFEVDKSVVQQISACDNSFLTNQYTELLEQASRQDATLTYRQGYQVKNMIGPMANHISANGVCQQAAHCRETTPMQRFYGKQEAAGFLETSQEKEMMATTPLQNVATLDPTEKKILFGSDDNMWDVFGKGASMGMGGFNKLDGTDFSLASVSSGTWSALMQSAVAETSNGDPGLQDEWSGLSFCATENIGNHQLVGLNESSSMQPVWPDKGSRTVMLNGSPSFPLGSGGDVNTSYNCTSLDQQSGLKNNHGQSDGSQTNSNQRSTQQQLSEARWLDQKFLQKGSSEGSNIYANTGKVGSAYQMNPVVNSTIEMEHAESAVNCHNREDANMENVSAVPVSKDIRANAGKNEQLPHGDNLNLWKYNDPRVNIMPNDFQSHIETRRQTFDLPGSYDSDKMAIENHEVGKSHIKENSSESFRSIVSQHVPFGAGMRENVWLDAGDSRDSRSSGLQLAPPSQQLLNNYQASSSHSSLQPVKIVNSTYIPHGARVPSRSMASPYNIQEKNSAAFNSDFPSPRNRVQNKSFMGASGQANLCQSPCYSRDKANMQSKQMDASCDRGYNAAIASVPHILESAQENDLASLAVPLERNGTNQAYAGDSTQKFPLLEPLSAPRPSAVIHMSQEGPSSNSVPNLLFNVPSQPYLSGAPSPNNYPERTNIEESQSVKESTQPQVCGEADSVRKTIVESDGRAYVVNWSDASPSNAVPTEQDIEAFGRTLRSDNNGPGFSFCNQMQGLGNDEVEPGNRSVKRFKGPDGSQQSYRDDAVARDAAMKFPPPPSTDLRMHLTSKAGDGLNTSPSMKDMCLFSQSHSPNIPTSNSSAVIRGDRPQISPQMAPSWFDQYGTFKIGQALPTCASKGSLVTVEQPLLVDRTAVNSLALSSGEKVNSTVDASKHGKIQRSSDQLSIASEHFSSTQLLSSQVTEETFTKGANKHSIVTSELLPWFDEVTQDFQRFQNISMAELEWARATNRRGEKIEEDDDLIESGPPLVRPKRRLILTTQLMQQLLRPPAASVCSADVGRQFENVIYFIARLALGDACTSISFSGKHSPLSQNRENIPCENVTESEKVCELDLSKVAEQFIVKAEKLEDDLLRLEKRASILDLRLGFHDLEKFSILNRFAVFHTRGQDGAQRHVTAIPMPKNLPEDAQCLSL